MRRIQLQYGPVGECTSSMRWTKYRQLFQRDVLQDFPPPKHVGCGTQFNRNPPTYRCRDDFECRLSESPLNLTAIGSIVEYVLVVLDCANHHIVVKIGKPCTRFRHVRPTVRHWRYLSFRTNNSP